MSALVKLVIESTDRGECKCGRCCDVGTKPDPTGHTVNMVFFVVSKRGEVKLEDFLRLTTEHKGEFGPCNPLDGAEHSYLELGGWIGDQGLALQYMALGVLLGVFKLLSPITVLGLKSDNPLVSQLAGSGFLSIRKVGTDREEKALQDKLAVAVAG